MDKLNTGSLFQSLQSQLIQLDEDRLVARQKVRRIDVIGLLALVISGSIIVWVNISEYGDLAFYSGVFLLIIVIFAWAIKRSLIVKAFSLSYKEKVIGKIIQKIDSSFVYTPEHKFRFNSRKDPLFLHLEKTSLFPSFAKGSSEDAITGTIGASRFEFSELKLESGGKNSRTVFAGVTMKISLKQNVSPAVYVLPDSANKFRDSLWKTLHLTTKRGEVVELPHEAFENLFKVYSSDATLANSLLKRALLDKLVSMHEKISRVNTIKDAISLAFIDDAVTIAVKLDTNLFEPKLSQPINDQTYFEKNAQYLVLFLGLIESLNPND